MTSCFTTHFIRFNPLDFNEIMVSYGLFVINLNMKSNNPKNKQSRPGRLTKFNGSDNVTFKNKLNIHKFFIDA